MAICLAGFYWWDNDVARGCTVAENIYICHDRNFGISNIHLNSANNLLTHYH